MARDWNRSSVDWEASAKAGAFVMMEGEPMKGQPINNARTTIEELLTELRSWHVLAGSIHIANTERRAALGAMLERQQALIDRAIGELAAGVPEQHTRSRLGKPVKLARTAARPEYRRHHAEAAVVTLKNALTHARAAGAPYTVERIKLALSSARGAVRNAGYRVTRAGRRG
jgi:hypothetical protein